MVVKKSDFVEKVAVTAGVSKTVAKQVIDATLTAITEDVANGNSVRFVGFGTFSTRHKKAGVAKNPQTGEKIEYKAKEVPVFKAGTLLKEACNAG